jgi:hypothetical protein
MGAGAPSPYGIGCPSDPPEWLTDVRHTWGKNTAQRVHAFRWNACKNTEEFTEKTGKDL